MCVSTSVFACQDIPEAWTDTTATSTSTSTASATSEPTAGKSSGPDATDSTGDGTGSTGDETGSTGGDSTGVEKPCPEVLPEPTSCDPVAEACGNATPIAGAAQGYLSRELALTDDDVWFIMYGGDCAALYRVPKAGGDAHRVRAADRVYAIEADGETVYLLERTLDPEDPATVIALNQGVEKVLGTVERSAELTRTPAGVITYDGPHVPYFLLSASGMSFIEGSMQQLWGIGSVPTYDGDRLFFSWTHSPDGGDLYRALLGVSSDTNEELAENAMTRRWPIVAVDEDDVFFATGDPAGSIDDWEPVGVSRVAKSGGPATPLLAPAMLSIDEVLVDEDDVFFRDQPVDRFAVSKQGGAPRHVWHGGESGYARIDDEHLYFIVRGPQSHLPLPGHHFVVRVAKATSLP